MNWHVQICNKAMVLYTMLLKVEEIINLIVKLPPRLVLPETFSLSLSLSLSLFLFCFFIAQEIRINKNRDQRLGLSVMGGSDRPGHVFRRGDRPGLLINKVTY